MIAIARKRFSTLISGDSPRAQLVRGGIGSLGIKVLGTVLAFAQGLLLARILGPAGYGAYAFVLSLITLLSIPAQVGLPQVVVRETAKAHEAEDWSLIRGLWRWANRFVGVFSVVMIGVGVLVLAIGGNWLNGERWSTLAVALLLVPLGALASIRAAALQGLKRVLLGQLPELLIKPGLIFTFVGLAFFALGDRHLTVSQAMFLNVLATLFAFLIGATMLRHGQPLGLRCGVDRSYQTSYWRRAAMPLAILGGLQLINHQVDIIMLGLMHSDHEVGIYRVVVQVATLVIFGLSALSLLLQPYFAAFFAKGDISALQELVTKSARVILLLALFPVVLLVFFGDNVLEVFFGKEYVSGYLPLVILALGQLVNAAMGFVGMLLNMTGHERDTVRGVAIASVTNVLLNSVLIPIYGGLGAAIASSLTLIVWNIILRHYALKRLSIESTFVGKTSRHR